MNRPTEQCRMQVSELQRRLARKAAAMPQHRFTNLYDLLTWEPLMHWAFDRLTASAAWRIGGAAEASGQAAARRRDEILPGVRAALKHGSYRHLPARRNLTQSSRGCAALDKPVLIDRLVQLMVKAILEPIFESDFYQESHGFRPEKSCHTAVAQLYLMTAPAQKNMCWAIRGHIAGYFCDAQQHILARLLRRRVQDQRLIRLIRQMLRAGVMGPTLFAGAAQGALLSPLLANIYLHELDSWLQRSYSGLSPTESNHCHRQLEGNALYVRYGTDFTTAWSGSKAGAEQLRDELAAFLQDHLKLKLAEESRIAHVAQGYEFLGFTIRRYAGSQRGRNTLIARPSTASVAELKARIKALTARATAHDSISDKLAALNSLLRGWASYYRYHAAGRTLNFVGSYAFKRMEIWLCNKTGKRARAVYKQYHRRHSGYLTWVCGSQALYRPGTLAKRERLRYRHRPNPYLDASRAAPLSDLPGP